MESEFTNKTAEIKMLTEHYYNARKHVNCVSGVRFCLGEWSSGEFFFVIQHYNSVKKFNWNQSHFRCSFDVIFMIDSVLK